MAQDGLNSWNVEQPPTMMTPPHSAVVQLFISVEREQRHMPLTFLSPYANKALLIIFGEFLERTKVHTMLAG